MSTTHHRSQLLQSCCLRSWPFGSVLAGVLAIALLASPASAQTDFDGTDLFPDLSLGEFGQNTSQPSEFAAEYRLIDGTDEGEITVQATLGSGWHIYSQTQPPGGPLPTKLSIQAPESVQASGGFHPDRPPAKSVSDIYDGLTIEEYEDSVEWTARLIVPAGFRDQIQVAINGLVCKTDGSCVPVEEVLTAKFAGTLEKSALVAVNAPQAAAAQQDKPKAAKPFRDEDYAVEWVASSSSQIAPGGRGLLEFTAKPDAKFHVYRAAVDDTESSTNFVVTNKDGLLIGAPATKEKVISETIAPGFPPVHYHKGNVTWKLPVEVPAGTTAGEHTIEGYVAYQACKDQACLRPKALKFKATVTVGKTTDPKAMTPVQLVAAKSAAAMDAAANTKWVDKIEPVEAAVVPVPSADSADKAKASTSFPIVLLFAFIGGVILNVMPCVLPVVGLKVMSFVQQAGEDRKRILMLNVVYSLGILSVFAILAGLAVALSFSWGEQFTYFPVRLGLTLLLFALALSYLGVWEIPVPGMAAGRGSQELQNREGYTGAFFKGVFATILATPCSGPLLGGILGLTIGLHPLETIVVIMTVGLGMSLPYLIIGLRPSLVSWLPKPGDWMETLKEFLAFLFLGTVAFFFNQFSDADKLPVFVALIGVWFGCWVIGKVPNWEALQKRLSAWATGVAAATVIGFLAFKLLGPAELDPNQKTIAWEPYDEVRLAQLQNEGRTVMVDFTAKWCVNCIVNYNVALNTEQTRQLLEELDAVPMLADWTDRDPVIKKKLLELQSNSIPLLAIYPGANPASPIVLRDLVSQGAVLQALRNAGPSQAEGIARRADKPVTSLTSSGRVASLAH